MFHCFYMEIQQKSIPPPLTRYISRFSHPETLPKTAFVPCVCAFHLPWLYCAVKCLQFLQALKNSKLLEITPFLNKTTETSEDGRYFWSALRALYVIMHGRWLYGHQIIIKCLRWFVIITLRTWKEYNFDQNFDQEHIFFEAHRTFKKECLHPNACIRRQSKRLSIHCFHVYNWFFRRLDEQVWLNLYKYSITDQDASSGHDPAVENTLSAAFQVKPKKVLMFHKSDGYRSIPTIWTHFFVLYKVNRTHFFWKK